MKIRFLNSLVHFILLNVILPIKVKNNIDDKFQVKNIWY